MNTIYGRDGNIYETGIRGMNSEPFIQSELIKNELNQLEMQVENLKEQKYSELIKENKQLKDKLSKIETLIINHNCDTGDIYYKYNSKFLKSELKQRILEIVYEQGSGSDE